MPNILVKGVEVFYRDEGNGPAVVLGHSSTGSGGQWRSLFTRLINRYRLIAPDHLGYGRTGTYPGSIPLVDHEVAIILRMIELAGGPVHLVGHSYGGSLMARMTLVAPERVRSLTLIEPTLFYLLAPAGMHAEHEEIWAVADRVIRYVDAGNVDEAARGFIGYWVGPGAYDGMDERTRAAVVGSMAKLRIEWPTAFEAQGATAEALASLQMPIHLMVGRKTTRAASAVIEVLRRIWPKARCTEIEDAGHMAPLTHAEPVNGAIEAFLDARQVD
jgi:pimeloyl-ACP methyl ester carboxylesterase